MYVHEVDRRVEDCDHVDHAKEERVENDLVVSTRVREHEQALHSGDDDRARRRRYECEERHLKRGHEMRKIINVEYENDVRMGELEQGHLANLWKECLPWWPEVNEQRI